MRPKKPHPLTTKHKITITDENGRKLETEFLTQSGLPIHTLCGLAEAMTRPEGEPAPRSVRAGAPAMAPASPTTPPAKVDQKMVTTILMLERTLLTAIDPKTAVTPDQLVDLCEMLVTLMSFRKVEPDFWVEQSDLVFKLVRLAAGITSEARLINQSEGVTAECKATMKAACEISLKEINGMRVKLLETVKLLQKCPLPGATIH